MTQEEIKKALEEGGELTITMKDLQGILGEAIKGMELPQVMALKNEMDATYRKQIFPDGEGGVMETAGKSIVDTNFFTKSFQPKGRIMSGEAMGAQLRSSGGPFVSLSKEMEQFAVILACRGDMKAAESKGVSVGEYNAMVKEQYRKVFGEKALTTTDAGALVPVEYLATVVEFATAQSQILSKVWKIPMGSQMLKIPKLVQAAGSYFGGIVLFHPDEGALKGSTKPTFDSLTFTAKKLIGLCPLTDELIMDSAINIVNYITGLFVRAFQWETESEIISGSGVGNAMLGIVSDPLINLVPRTTPGTVKYDDLINLESSLDENFQDLSWISRRATVNTFRKQKDSVGQPVYHDGFTTFLGAAMVPQLLGYPLIKTRNVSAMGIKGDLILGDLGFYIWAMRQDMTVDQAKWRFEYDETTLRFVIRQDGAPAVSEAFAILDGGLS